MTSCSTFPGLVILPKLNLNPALGVSLIGEGWIMMCFFGDAIPPRRELPFKGDGDFPNGVSSPTTRRFLVGAGVTGDCNLFTATLGGINAGVSFKISFFGTGDGKLSKMGWRAVVKSRRLIL